MRACDVESPADFRRYYTGWLGVGDNPTVPLKFRGEDGANIHFSHLKETADGIIADQGKYIFKWDECVKSLVFGSPYVGMCVSRGVLHYGSILAERQWNRGFVPDRTHWNSFTSWALRELHDTTPTGASYDVIWHVFNPKYDTIQTALLKLEAGQQVGAALSRYYGMYTLPEKEHPAIAYKRWTIGYVLPDKRIILGSKYREYEEDLKVKFNADIRIE